MKRNFAILALILALLVPLAVTNTALAINPPTGVEVNPDVEINAPINSVTVALTKHGKEYVRIGITEQRTKNGHKYPADVLVMVYDSNLVVKAKKNLKQGQTLKCIAKKQLYNGDISYVARVLL